MKMIRESSSGVAWCKDVGLLMAGVAAGAGIAVIAGYRSDLFTAGKTDLLVQEFLLALIFLACGIVAIVCWPLARLERRRHKVYNENTVEFMRAIEDRQPHEAKDQEAELSEWATSSPQTPPQPRKMV